ncbi:unnamed protein product [Brassica oleracea var. botrytis]|uniref:Uncharacterized protein n=1 Tax=Brassica oleracea TaxID=3712 RepID=A0A3P6FPC4_BRAOL|nr:unnamed protein product [Brassica oleracea]VDD54230.1 unnamed protein product [Brassica oleracea]
MVKNNVRLQMRLVHNNFASACLSPCLYRFILMEQPKHTTNERKTTISEFYGECPVVIHLFHVHEFKV